MSNRYYEGMFPPFNGEPLKTNIALVHLDTHGEGMAANRRFEPGELVFKFAGERVDIINLYTLEHPDGYHIYDPVVMGKILHSCEPNMVCDMRAQTFHATRAIEKDELLTMDYCTTETVLSRSFECQCGSLRCKGVIVGKDTQPVLSVTGVVGAR